MFQTIISKRLQYINKCFYSTNKGYVVLIPEIGEDSKFDECILNSDGFPKFNEITIENCLGAIGQRALAFETSVKEIEDDISTGIGVDEIFAKIERETASLDVTWGIAKALYLGNSTLIPTKSYMNVHNRALSARASKFANKTIYSKIKNEYDKAFESPQDYNQKRRLMEKYILEGKLNGLEVTKSSWNNLQETIVNLGNERKIFKKKLDAAVNSFGHLINDYNLVRNFPESFLRTVALDSNKPKEGPWKISLQPEVLENFLKYCSDRTERWNLWQANVRKCSTQLEKGLENSTHIEKIRSLRRKQANILGYSSYSEMSMETKMIKSVANAKSLFTNLLQSAGPAQSVEIENLQRFALDCGFDKKLESYDVPYWQRKYLKTYFDIDEDRIKQYFPLTKVIKELFDLTERIFGIKIAQRNVEVWQPTVKYFDVFDCDIDSRRPVGGFYLDCYSKEATISKSSARMASIRNKNKTAGNSPLCTLIFNFQGATPEKQNLLCPAELAMLFKTFGTGMQHILTRAEYSDLAGLSNIEWDASEITGEVMANFLYDKEILAKISSHFVTEDPISSNFVTNINLLKTQFAGYKLCEEIYYSDLDLEMYQSNEFWLDLVKKLWPIYRCMPLDKKDAHPCSMTEIFSGDWGAAYFSHLHSKIIAADVYDAFSNKKSTDSLAQIGKRYKETFLALGGSVPTAEVFRRFRGRDPSVEAFLKSLNLLVTCQISMVNN